MRVYPWGKVKFFDGDFSLPTYLDDAKGDSEGTVSYFGAGRSYGDVALSNSARMVGTGLLSRFIEFDRENGVLRAEAGVTLDQILSLIVPHGWFLPVSPGTKYVTIGGAVANDVHGKNHHYSGSLGAYIQAIGLSRSKEGRLTLSAKENTELFNYTISGLGLTGMIEWVELKLIPIESSYFDVENIPYENLDAFFELSEESQSWPYTVAWLDCLASGEKLGRGAFTRAKHALDDRSSLKKTHRDPKLSMPMNIPRHVLNKSSIGAFNALYYRKPSSRYKGRTHYDPFLYPLDGIRDWNKLYGKAGFYQFQSIVPMEQAKLALRDQLNEISEAGMGSFLAVLKIHGKETSPGMNTFSMEGASLALDFPNRGEKTLKLLSKLEELVRSNGGRIYPAKDATMSAETFQSSYPNWVGLETLRDPAINTQFWQRVTGN